MFNYRCACPALVTLILAAWPALAVAGEVKEPQVPKFAFKGHEAAVRSLSFSPDGKMLVSKDKDTAIWLWDVVEGKANRVLGKTPDKALAGPGGFGGPVAFAPGGKKVVIAADKMEVWDIDPGKPKMELQKPRLSTFYLDFAASRVPMELNDVTFGGVTPILFSPDGKFVARPTSGPKGKHVRLLTPVQRHVRRLFFHVWDLASGEPAAEDASHLKWLRPAFSQLTDGDVRSLHASQQSLGGMIRAISADHELLVSPAVKIDKQKTVTSPWVSVWELDSGKLFATLPLDTKGQIHTVAISADGRLVAAGGDDAIVRVWEVPGWKDRKRKEVTKSFKKEYLEVNLGDGVKMKLVRIEPGKFMMGSSKAEQDYAANLWPPVGKLARGWLAAEKQHEVEITKSFYMGVYPVTQAQYEKVMGKNPSAFSASSGNKQVRSWTPRRFRWRAYRGTMRWSSARSSARRRPRALTYRRRPNGNTHAGPARGRRFTMARS
jgi:formylglycine-generating enzyme required for sulfatase activity